MIVRCYLDGIDKIIRDRLLANVVSRNKPKNKTQNKERDFEAPPTIKEVRSRSRLSKVGVKQTVVILECYYLLFYY